jgi:hypothetical protein
MFKWLKEWRENRAVKSMHEQLKHDAQFLYRCGYNTDEVAGQIRAALSYNNDLTLPEWKAFLRSLPRLCASFHPTNPVYFERVS